jgi:hypothetical protein
MFRKLSKPSPDENERAENGKILWYPPTQLLPRFASKDRCFKSDERTARVLLAPFSTKYFNTLDAILVCLLVKRKLYQICCFRAKHYFI